MNNLYKYGMVIPPPKPKSKEISLRKSKQSNHEMLDIEQHSSCRQKSCWCQKVPSLNLIVMAIFEPAACNHYYVEERGLKVA